MSGTGHRQGREFSLPLSKPGAPCSALYPLGVRGWVPRHLDQGFREESGLQERGSWREGSWRRGSGGRGSGRRSPGGGALGGGVPEVGPQRRGPETPPCRRSPSRSPTQAPGPSQAMCLVDLALSAPGYPSGTVTLPPGSQRFPEIGSIGHSPSRRNCAGTAGLALRGGGSTSPRPRLPGPKALLSAVSFPFVCPLEGRPVQEPREGPPSLVVHLVQVTCF